MFTRVKSTLIFAVLLAVGNPVLAEDSGRVLVQSTTSTENSGLYGYLLPKFESETGLRVDVVAVGTGQAIKNARNGDADVLLVHAKSSEETFVADGYGVERFDLMYNDFVVIGPANDPAKLRDSKDVQAALEALSNCASPFISRGDDSGTNKKERQLWQAAKLEAFAKPSTCYQESGSGMGATIRLAIEKMAYTITDRATWIAYEDKQSHTILFEGAPELFNQYGVIAVNSTKHPHVNTKGAETFINWLLSDHGQKLIATYKVADQQLFFPYAK